MGYETHDVLVCDAVRSPLFASTMMNLGRTSSMKKMAFLLLVSLPLSVSFVTNKGPQRLQPSFLATLEPQENPTADPTKTSNSGVTYSSVLDGLHQLYPPSDLAKRNAASRTDGYWPYVQKGEDPPKQLTYGEFDFYFFAELLDRAQEVYYEGKDADAASWNDKVFCDIGSGTGRLVMAAAALHPGWKLCRGVELLNSIHVVAQETLAMCNPNKSADTASEKPPTSSSLIGEEDILRQFQGQFVLEKNEVEEDVDEEDVDEKDEHDEAEMGDLRAAIAETSYYLPSSSESEEKVKLAPIDFAVGSFDDRSVYFGDSDCVFVFSSCMSSSIVSGLSKAIGRQCKPGTIVITTEFPLELEGVIDSMDDPDEQKYAHCDYDGDFDDPDDAEEWARFCEEEGIEAKPFKFELVESLDGYCWLMGGFSTAHIHRVITSAWEEGASPSSTQEISEEEQAAMAWIYGLKHHTDDFYRDVRNNMVFHGFSEKWCKELEE